ncbi:keratin-associated protein 10-7-like isoform X2 [Panthera tigris]|uniref:keratin-associated protein 10-7-like isoform X2 n=1 Tax=Panthera tigris TaxID=9694 RepID=UPI001C6F987A|nr:keratin-associated protein 10-7-like isoform X2 [Panthera tigris]
MASPSRPVCSISILFSPVSNCTSILCLRLPFTPCFYTVCDQAPGSTSLLSSVSDAAVFPDPSLLRDCGFDPSCSSAGGSHRALAGCRPHPGSFTGPGCCRCPETATGCQPPQKKFPRSCSSSVSGITENHNTHLAPGFTLNDLVPAPANVVVLPGPLGPLPVGDPHSLYPMSSQRGNCLSPCGPKNPGLRSAPGDSPFPPEHHQGLL